MRNCAIMSNFFNYRIILINLNVKIGAVHLNAICLKRQMLLIDIYISDWYTV